MGTPPLIFLPMVLTKLRRRRHHAGRRIALRVRLGLDLAPFPAAGVRMPAYQYIYVMKDLSKTYPGGREVLKDIWLSFLPGAKIGVLGANGAGKSTLLRIMAGIDADFVGEAWAAEGVKVGYLAQEPALDPAKDVAGNVTEGLAETKALLERFEAVNARFAEELLDEEVNDLLVLQ